jgi:hypothetical protein
VEIFRWLSVYEQSGGGINPLLVGKDTRARKKAVNAVHLEGSICNDQL